MPSVSMVGYHVANLIGYHMASAWRGEWWTIRLNDMPETAGDVAFKRCDKHANQCRTIFFILGFDCLNIVQ